MLKMKNPEQRDLLYLLFGKIISVFIALISVRVATTLLDAEELGKNYLLLTLITLMSFTFFAPIGQYFSRKSIEWKNKNILKTSIHVLISIRSIAIIISILISIFVYYFAGYKKYYTLDVYVAFLCLSLIGTTTVLFFSTINILGNRLLFTKLTIALALLSIFCSTMFVLYFEATGLSWLYGIITAQLFFLLPSYYLLIRPKRIELKVNAYESINLSYCKKIFYFIAPVSITLFLQWGQNSSYRFFVEAKYSVELLGLMGVGFVVSTAVFSAIDNVATQYFNPIYFKNISGTNKVTRTKIWNEYSINLISIYIVTLAFIVGTAPFLLKILVDEKYYHVYKFVMLGALVDFFRVSCNVIYMVSQSEINTRRTILPYAIGFILLVLLLMSFNFSESAFMIPLIQAITYFVIALLLYLNMQKILPVKLSFLLLYKAILFSMPLYLISLVPTDISISNSLLTVIAAGGYFIIAIYSLIFKKNLRK